MSKLLRSIAPIFLAFGLQPLPALSQQGPGSAEASIPHVTSAGDGQHDFNFETGTWTTHLRRLRSPLSGSSAWVEYEGTTVVRQVMDGRANLVELVADGPAGRIEGLSLRLYQPKSRQWTLNFSSMADGLLTVPMIGAFKDGRGEFYAEDTFNGRPILVRFVITPAGPNVYRFEQAFSADGGRTWEVNWIATDTRRADAAMTRGTSNPRQFARTFDQAQLNRDITSLQTMLAEDLVFVDGSGRLQGKREFIEGYSAPTLRIEPFEIVKPTFVQIGADGAIAGGEVVLRGSEDGKAFASHFRFADTFARRDGRWQVVHIQVTSIPPKAK
jgi:ketosteroid isomerase-like protein